MLKKQQDAFEFDFKNDIPFEYRASECQKILQRQSNRIPLIIQRAQRETDIEEIKQQKYLVPTDFTYQQFLEFIRQKLNVSKNTGIYIFFSNNKFYQGEKAMTQVYEECKDEDGFLYCKYAGTEVFG
ncbi:UNKNOWN [Stylonychia lemnae]|uniref:Autophagy-related protein n=1 Tax=Stylonychia lemnae TaxID=5949 RepID=A0A078APT7_STYLE|nr:UNKNOWN [Stylonychia lemnae]|eukprot:CDW83981.1 UNKNOWN [Stylonychia lemnae]